MSKICQTDIKGIKKDIKRCQRHVKRWHTHVKTVLRGYLKVQIIKYVKTLPQKHKKNKRYQTHVNKMLKRCQEYVKLIDTSIGFPEIDVTNMSKYIEK